MSEWVLSHTDIYLSFITTFHRYICIKVALVTLMSHEHVTSVVRSDLMEFMTFSLFF